MEDKSKRKNRNKRYYRKQKKVGEGVPNVSNNVIQLFPTEDILPTKPNPHLETPVVKLISILGCLLLVLTLTSYLIGETIDFFSKTEGQGYQAVLKGCLCETIVIAFSLFSFKDLFTKILQRVVLVGMLVYSLWAISSGVLLTAHKEYRESDMIKKMIVDTEVELATKDTIIQKYLERDWISAARATQKDSDVLRRRLNDLRSRSTEVKPPHLILNTVLNLVIFRLLIMVSNIICLRRLKELVSGVAQEIKTSEFSLQLSECGR